MAHQRDLRLSRSSDFRPERRPRREERVRRRAELDLPRHRRRRRGRFRPPPRVGEDHRPVRRSRREPPPWRVPAIALALGNAHLGAGGGPGDRDGSTHARRRGNRLNAVIDVPLFSLPVRLSGATRCWPGAFGVFEAMISLSASFGSILGPALIGAAGVRPAMIVTGLTLPALALLSWHHHGLDDRLAVREEEIRSPRRTPMLGCCWCRSSSTSPAGSSGARSQRDDGGRAGTRGDRVYVIARGGRGDRRRAAGRDADEGEGTARSRWSTASTAPATVRARTDLDLFELAGDDFPAAIGAWTRERGDLRATVDRHPASLQPLAPSA